MNVLTVDASRSAECGEGISASPYPGLRPFSERESRFFFGRECEIAAILSLLEQRQLVVVHGASGCGKSSVVRAGVVPVFRLDAMANSREGKVIIVRPADPGGPLQSLARKLERDFPRETAEDESGTQALPWPTLLAVSPNWAEDIGAVAAAAGTTLCIVLDQFEEIFAVNRVGSAAEVRRIIDFLIGLGEPAPEGTALGERSLSVIVTMRSDYLGHCAIWDGFAEAVNRCQYLLPKISTVGLLRAIHEPARRVGAVVTEGVADRLLPVIAREIDGLPILQHALMRAWHSGGCGPDGHWTVNEDALDAVGGAEHALSRHADESFALATQGDQAREEAAEWIFRSLSDLDSDGRVIRRPVSLKLLAEESGADIEMTRSILDAFRHPAVSLVMPFLPEALVEKSIVSISHEALLRQWSRITDTQFDKNGRVKGLVYREFQDGMIWRSLVIQAQTYAQDGTSVLGAAATEQRLPWYLDIEKRPGWTARHAPQGMPGSERQSEWAKVADFMGASERNLRKEQELVARVQRNQRLVGISSAAITLLVLTLAAAVVYFNTYRTYTKEAMAKSEAKNAQDKVDALVNLQKSMQVYANQVSTSTILAWRHCGGVYQQRPVTKACIDQNTTRYLNLIASPSKSAISRRTPNVPSSAYMGGIGSPTDAQNTGDRK